MGYDVLLQAVYEPAGNMDMTSWETFHSQLAATLQIDLLRLIPSYSLMKIFFISFQF